MFPLHGEWNVAKENEKLPETFDRGGGETYFPFSFRLTTTFCKRACSGLNARQTSSAKGAGLKAV